MNARFRDRRQAGELLAGQLMRYARPTDAIVLALPRGGVPVGYAIAQRLGIVLDVLVVRKLGMPGREEFAIGAVGSGGVRVLKPGMPGSMGLTELDVDTVTARELAELMRREQAYRGMHAPLDLVRRRAILVDDGVATGSTMLAAIEVARRLRPAELVLAIPVAPPATVRMLAPLRFRSVGEWYDSFEQTDDAQVQQLLADAWRGRQSLKTQPEGPNHETDDGYGL